MAKTNFQSVDEYIATFPEETQKALEEVRSIIKSVAPEAKEKISYQIAAFELNGKNLIHFAGWKNHISIYPIPAGTDAFNKVVLKYADGKGTVKFPLDQLLPSKLIRQIVKYRLVDHLKNTEKNLISKNKESDVNMGKVVFNMTMSLDGFVAGPNDSPDNGLGDGGEALHNWYFSGDTEIKVSEGTPVLKVSKQSAKILRESLKTYGAGVWGRRTFDIARAWGGHPPGSPCFIVTHTVPQEWVTEGSPFIFVTDGVESAIRQARETAGDKDVVICTPSILQQCLKAGLVDEICVDLAPVLLGGGVRLFDNLGTGPIELERTRVVEVPGVTHLIYRVVK